MTGRSRPYRGATMAGGAGFLLTGCGGPLSTLDPAGPAAGSIATLWWIMLLAAGVILAGVMGLLITLSLIHI